jgi:eukaryotic-like serine/threonine-protein kinase
MRTFFRFVLRSLVLAVVALISALVAMSFAIHGREIAVPDLLNQTPAEARRIAQNEGFAFEVERQYYSANVPEGKILSQLPPVGTLVRRGWEIRVAESLGAQRVEIPQLVGESERAATMNIQRRGLQISSVAAVPYAGAVPDQVLAQSPPSSANGIAAPKLSLLVAAQPPPQAFLMPSFIGQFLGSATLTLRNSGLQLGAVTLAASAASAPVPTQVTPASIITSQTPAAGDKILANGTVSFQVR